MATLLFTAIGTILGGPLGGAIGALAGQQVDSLLLGGGTREGARLKDLSVTTASYGDALPRHFGRMRVAGSLIWATDLVEHSDSQGGGKGQPSVTSYTYTCSFAVALASRPLLSVGRIWADGNLLVGSDGKLTVGGSMRSWLGQGDQPVDPLIAGAEGDCPAFRGLAYMVFEDLQLADFGNRIPALTFEVLADEGPLDLAMLCADVVDDVDAGVALNGLQGLSCEGALSDVLDTLRPVFPMSCDAGGETLTIARERLQGDAILLGEPTASDAQDSFGARSGFQRKRASRVDNPPRVLRYYDVGRDYQPGSQRAGGRPLPGQPSTIELPAAMSAIDARALIGSAARNNAWSRETIAWRTAELDAGIAPGALVRLPGQGGTWRVLDWEWRETGVELTLERAGAGSAVAVDASSGRGNLAADRPVTATVLAAAELPWDGTGSGDQAITVAATSSAGVGWAGAQLFADAGSGNLAPLGAANRTRAIIGTVASALAPAEPTRFDRGNALVVTLASPDFELARATNRQPAAGANRALVGGEVVQFGSATRQGDGTWRLEHLLRGRGGTEQAIYGHAANETFVLVDGPLTSLDAAKLDGASTIAALGLADSAPVEAPVAGRGLTLRPLSPVHAQTRWAADGSLTLAWTRRARGAWGWPDQVDIPLNEQVEAYEVAYGAPGGTATATWITSAPTLAIDAAAIANLRAALADGWFQVRQKGTWAYSLPLALMPLS